MKLFLASLIISASALLQTREESHGFLSRKRQTGSMHVKLTNTVNEPPADCDPEDCEPDAIRNCKLLWDKKQEECEKYKEEWHGMCPAPKYTDSTGNVRDCKRGCCSEEVQEEHQEKMEDQMDSVNSSDPSGPDEEPVEECLAQNDHGCLFAVQHDQSCNPPSWPGDCPNMNAECATLVCTGAIQCADNNGITCAKSTATDSESTEARNESSAHEDPAGDIMAKCPNEANACVSDPDCGAIFEKAIKEGPESMMDEIKGNEKANAVMECMQNNDDDEEQTGENTNSTKEGSCLCGEDAEFFADKQLPDWDQGRTCSKEIGWACTENPSPEQQGGIRYMKHHCCKKVERPEDPETYVKEHCPEETAACLADEECSKIFQRAVAEGHESMTDEIKANELASSVLGCVHDLEAAKQEEKQKEEMKDGSCLCGEGATFFADKQLPDWEQGRTCAKEIGMACSENATEEQLGQTQYMKHHCCEKVDRPEDPEDYVRKACPAETETCLKDSACASIFQRAVAEGHEHMMDDILANDLASEVMKCVHSHDGEKQEEKVEEAMKDGSCLCGENAGFFADKQLPDWAQGRTCSKEISWACTPSPNPEQLGGIRYMKHHCCEKIERPEDPGEFVKKTCPSEAEACLADAACAALFQRAVEEGHENMMDEIGSNELASAVMTCVKNHEQAEQKEEEKHDMQDGSCLCGEDAEFFADKQLPDWEQGRTCSKEISWGCTENPSPEQQGGIRYMKHHCCKKVERPADPGAYVKKACPTETDACLSDPDCAAIFQRAVEEGHEHMMEDIAANALASAVMKCVDEHENEKQEGETQEGETQEGEKQDGDTQEGEKQDGEKQDGVKQEGEKQEMESEAEK